jgi:hypothetical protein
MKTSGTDVCLELKNINYQTMLLNNKTSINGNMKSECSEQIDDFLIKEKELNKNKPWNKLSKASRLKKLMVYTSHYIEKNKLENLQEKKLKTYLLDALDRRKLQKIKDVVYNIETGIIEDIPKLVFMKDKKKFTIKREKKSNTLNNLPPKTLKKNRKKKRKTEKEKKILKNRRKKIKNPIKEPINEIKEPIKE